MVEMTDAALTGICRERDLYITPSLNDKIYAGNKGFTSISGLEPYTSLQALFLNGNALTDISGLPSLPSLRCLFLEQNGITTLHNLHTLAPNLNTLDISSNYLTSLNDIYNCSALQTLTAANNQIKSLPPPSSSILPELESLDLQNNKIEYIEDILPLCHSIPNLKCLYLRGNPLVSTTASYRKKLVSTLPHLTYLDDRPITSDEQRCCQAWKEGGIKAEQDMREVIKQEERERHARLYSITQQQQQQLEGGRVGGASHIDIDIDNDDDDHDDGNELEISG